MHCAILQNTVPLSYLGRRSSNDTRMARIVSFLFLLFLPTFPHLLRIAVLRYVEYSRRLRHDMDRPEYLRN